MNYSYFGSNIVEISVEELATILVENDSSIQLIDVREREEVAIASIPQFHILPLSEFAQWSQEINTKFNPQVPTIIICHHGIRSAQMCQWLQNNGFSSVKNVRGGIDSYSLKVDSNIPRY
jgi:rhodanese-related sulfurtransferase